MAVALGLVAITGLLVLLSDPGLRTGIATSRAPAAIRGIRRPRDAIALGISRLLPWAQPHVVQAAARAAFPEAFSGFSPEASLGGGRGARALARGRPARAGATAPQASRVGGDAVRRVSVASHPWTPPRVFRRTYLGTSERPRQPGSNELPGQTFLVASPERRHAAGSPSERTRILLVLSVPGAIPAPAGVVAIRVAGQDVVVDAAEGILDPRFRSGYTSTRLVCGTPETGAAPGPDASRFRRHRPAARRARCTARAPARTPTTSGSRARSAYLQTELRLLPARRSLPVAPAGRGVRPREASRLVPVLRQCRRRPAPPAGCAHALRVGLPAP